MPTYSWVEPRIGTRRNNVSNIRIKVNRKLLWVCEHMLFNTLVAFVPLHRIFRGLPHGKSLLRFPFSVKHSLSKWALDHFPGPTYAKNRWCVFIRDLVIDSIGLGGGEKGEEGLELFCHCHYLSKVQREKRMQYSMIFNVQQRVNVLKFRSCDYPGDSYLEMIRNWFHHAVPLMECISAEASQ